MKTIRIFYHPALLLPLVGLLMLASSCKYNHPAEPPMTDYSKNAAIQRTHTIAKLKAIYESGAKVVDEEIVIKGQVASDDAEGNFYRSMSIQDETGGIELKLGGSNLGKVYPQGSTVVVLCKGLVLGQYGEQVSLGYRSADSKYENSFIPEDQVTQKVLPAGLGKLAPKVVSIETLSKQYANTLVKLENVQFVASEKGKTYANAVDKKTENRTLTAQSGKTIIVRTSGYARFAGTSVPMGSGSIVALLTYFRDTPQLNIIRESDVKLTQKRF